MGIFSDYLLCVDFDRTLTGPDSQIPQRNLEAIHRFMDNGGAFTVNTGRSIPMAQRIIQEVPVNVPLLLYNGAAAYDPATDTLPWTQSITLEPKALVERMQSLCGELTLECQGTRAHYCFSPNQAFARFYTGQQVPFSQITPEEIPAPFLKLSIFLPNADGSVSQLFQQDPHYSRLVDALEETLRREFGSELEILRSGTNILDMQTIGASKGRAARKLQQELGRKTLVCVGDAHNDIAMLQQADLAFVPADSALSDRFPTVCPCGQGAVADVIELLAARKA